MKKGTHFTPEQLEKLRISHLGQKAWNKGIPVSKNHRKYLSKKLKGHPMPKPKTFSETMRKANPPQGRKMTNNGYVLVYKPKHFGSIDSSGYIAEHRYILECFLNRNLIDKENVHHLNGDKSDNRIENLILCKNKRDHNNIHWKMQLLIFELIKKGDVYYDGENFKTRKNSKD